MTFPGNRSQEHSTIADTAGIGEVDTVGEIIAALGVGRVETKWQVSGPNSATECPTC